MGLNSQSINDTYKRSIETAAMKTSYSGKNDSIAIHYLVIGVILSVCTFLEQCFVFFVFYKHKHLRKVNNFYILSLASADLLISLLSMPLWTMFTTLGYWPLGRFSCDFWHGLDHALCAVSIYTIAFISMDRFRSIHRPLEYKSTHTRRRTIYCLVGIWVVNMIFWITFLYLTQHYYYEDTPTQECIVAYFSVTELTVFVAISIICIPVIVTVVFYLLTYRLAKAPDALRISTIEDRTEGDAVERSISSDFSEAILDSRGNSLGGSARYNNQRGSVMFSRNLQTTGVNRKALQTISVLLVTFIICWLPLGIIFFLQGFLKSANLKTWIIIGYWMGYANSLVNPICFAISNRSFYSCAVRQLKSIF